MFEELLNSGKLYSYMTDDNVHGIVIAESEEDAYKKVKTAYLQHGYCESELYDLTIQNIKDGWFKDNPDILEIYG